MGFVDAAENQDVHPELVRRTMTEGCNGLKAFFCATFSGQTQSQRDLEQINIKINTTRVLPVETW